MLLPRQEEKRGEEKRSEGDRTKMLREKSSRERRRDRAWACVCVREREDSSSSINYKIGISYHGKRTTSEFNIIEMYTYNFDNVALVFI